LAEKWAIKIRTLRFVTDTHFIFILIQIPRKRSLLWWNTWKENVTNFSFIIFAHPIQIIRLNIFVLPIFNFLFIKETIINSKNINNNHFKIQTKYVSYQFDVLDVFKLYMIKANKIENERRWEKGISNQPAQT